MMQQNGRSETAFHAACPRRSAAEGRSLPCACRSSRTMPRTPATPLPHRQDAAENDQESRRLARCARRAPQTTGEGRKQGACTRVHEQHSAIVRLPRARCELCELERRTGACLLTCIGSKSGLHRGGAQQTSAAQSPSSNATPSTSLPNTSDTNRPRYHPLSNFTSTASRYAPASNRIGVPQPDVVAHLPAFACPSHQKTVV